MAVPAPTLTYFNIEAVAEKCRLALVMTGTDFTDERVEFQDWPARKSSTPYGQMPTFNLNDGSKLYAQSNAIVRYVCNKYDQSGKLYPINDPIKNLNVEEAIGLVEDFQKDWLPCLYIGMMHTKFGYPEEWPEKPTVVKQLREKWLAEGLPKFMGFFVDMIKKNGGSFLCGPDITLADLYLLPQLRYFQKGIAEHVPSTCLDAYPEIIQYMDACYKVPQLAKWYQK